MSEEKATQDIEALKARIAELEAENEKLKQTIGEATKTLTAYVEKEREAVIRDILEKANLSEDELRKLDLAQLKLVQKSVNSVKGVFKNIRSAGVSTSEEENKLTVGSLYHKNEEE